MSGQNAASFLIIRILRSYTPGRMVFLDRHGTWREKPETLRDRISNEIWHALWLDGPAGEFRRCLAGLIAPNNRNSEPYFLSMLESVYHLVALKACQELADRSVAEWDATGKKKKREFTERAAKQAECVKQSVNECPDITYDAVEQGLVTSGPGAIRTMMHVIAEEESVRYQLLQEQDADSNRTELTRDMYALMHAAGDVSVLSLTHERRALLRICLEILSDRSVPMDSGLQFQASAVLGVLQDIRSLETIISTLAIIDKRNTNVRTNLIYALGMLCDGRSAPVLSDVLQGPESIVITTGGHQYEQSLNGEKCEAIWAMGKLGERALGSVPVLSTMASSESRQVRIALAWAMGTIGQAQKEHAGGVDARIMASLLSLLAHDDARLGEEVMQSMKNLDVPNFMYELNLRSAVMLPVLSLKPSCTGLYEISETLFHLLAEKKQVIMAVTGDSGTGKTYFCEALRGGFGGLAREDILYLMRDAPENRETFNRILGIRWLKDNVDQRFYADYPLTENADDPVQYLKEFSASFSGKRLIMLDGWLDDAYFSRIVKAFHSIGLLNLLVSFRAAYSTRRMNLEEREEFLENLNICLGNTESRPMEHTEFYYDPNLLIYILDNSRQSRLSQIEIKEMFKRQKIGAWGDHIRIENFERGLETIKAYPGTRTTLAGPIESTAIEFDETDHETFIPEEAHFERSMNDDLEAEPNLLQVVNLTGLDPERMIFYAHGQLAVGGKDGAIGLLTGLTDQQHVHRTHDTAVAGLCCSRGVIFSFDTAGNLKKTDFLKNHAAVLKAGLSAVTAINSDLDRRVVTGHDDGTVGLWDLTAGVVRRIKLHALKVTAVAVPGPELVVAVFADNRIDIYDTTDNNYVRCEGIKSKISAIDRHMTGQVVLGAGTEHPDGSAEALVIIMDARDKTVVTFPCGIGGHVTAVTGSAYGRVIVAANIVHNDDQQGVCAVLFPERGSDNLRMMGVHGGAIRSCTAMGPRVITCGVEKNSRPTLRIWGTESYVRTERDKLRFLGRGMRKPPFYHMVF